MIAIGGAFASPFCVFANYYFTLSKMRIGDDQRQKRRKMKKRNDKALFGRLCHTKPDKSEFNGVIV